MIVYDNDKVYRNLQQQVGKNQEDIARLKSGITVSYWVATISDLEALLLEENAGKYVVVGQKNSDNQYLYLIVKGTDLVLTYDKLGKWPDVVEGPKGDDGEDGATGPKGNSIYTCGYPLPSTSEYNEGDMVLCTVSPQLGNVYKKVSGQWLLQCNIRGAQGPMGPNGTDVVANPTAASSGAITKIKIDGIVYNIQGSEYTEGYGIEIGEQNDIGIDTGVVATRTYAQGQVESHNTSASAHATLFAGKQDTLTAGENITIVNNVISATGGGASYSAGDGISISNNTISANNTIARVSALNNKLDKEGIEVNNPQETYEFTILAQDDQLTPTKTVALDVCYAENEKSIGATVMQKVGGVLIGNAIGVDLSAATIASSGDEDHNAQIILTTTEGENGNDLVITPNDAVLTKVGSTNNSIATVGYVDTSVTGLITQDELDDAIEDHNDSSSAHYDLFQDVREIAAGKTQTFVISGTNNPGFKSDAGTLTVNTFITLDGTTHNYQDVKLGDNIYLTDTDYPDRWVSGVNTADQRFYASVLETAKAAVSDVKVNGTSVVSNNVANVPKADSTGRLGVMKVGASKIGYGCYGATVDSDGSISPQVLNDSEYWAAPNAYFVSKGTLENVFTSKGLVAVSGTNDGTNWTGLTVGNTTKSIPSPITYTAGTGIAISNNQISCTVSPGKTYTAGDGIYINDSDEISASVGTGLFFDSQDRIALNNASQAAIAAVAGKSTVTGTNDGTNWTTITVDGNTYAIPAGGGQGTITDVKVNGTSIVTEGVANIPIGDGTLGVLKADSYYQLQVDSGGAFNAKVRTYTDYAGIANNAFVSKGTLENVLDNETVRVDKAQSFDDTKKAQARSNIGASSTVVSGIGDESNWSSITIDGVTKNIPSSSSFVTLTGDQFIEGNKVLKENLVIEHNYGITGQKDKNVLGEYLLFDNYDSTGLTSAGHYVCINEGEGQLTITGSVNKSFGKSGGTEYMIQFPTTNGTVALSSEVVSKTATENIGGIKTFTSNSIWSSGNITLNTGNIYTTSGTMYIGDPTDPDNEVATKGDISGGGGGELYKHAVAFYLDYAYVVEIISSSPTEFTAASLDTWFQNNAYGSQSSGQYGTVCKPTRAMRRTSSTSFEDTLLLRSADNGQYYYGAFTSGTTEFSPTSTGYYSFTQVHDLVTRVM